MSKSSRQRQKISGLFFGKYVIFSQNVFADKKHIYKKGLFVYNMLLEII